MEQRLIDADALKEVFPDNGEGSWTYNVTIKACIDAQPTIDAVPHWIPVSERLPKTDGENSINSYNVLLWVREKNNPDDEPQIYIGKLLHLEGDDGSGNFWGIKINPSEWTIWGWSYFREPEVIAWMPLPKPYEVKND